MVRIDRCIANDDGWLSFSAVDADGDFIIRIETILFEEFQADAPVYADADDARDHAIGKMERLASALPVFVVGSKRTLTLMPDHVPY